jgi:hypothetical protein
VSRCGSDTSVATVTRTTAKLFAVLAVCTGAIVFAAVKIGAKLWPR